MDSTMEGMLDTYLLETEALLDKLDEMLIADEKVGDFSTDDVNEIFRRQSYGSLLKEESWGVLPHWPKPSFSPSPW